MNQWGLILWWIRSIACHTLPQSWMILLAMSACRSYRENNMIECHYGYSTQQLKRKTPPMPWNCGVAYIAFCRFRFWTATEESQMTGHRKICQISLRVNIHNHLCLLILKLLNIVRCEYDIDVCGLVEFPKGSVCCTKQSTFMGLNSLILRYCTRSGHRISSAFVTLGIP